MEHGIVRDWDDMERIWQYIYSKDQLQTFSEEVRMVVLVGQGVLVLSLRRMNFINSACWLLFHAFVVVVYLFLKLIFERKFFRNNI